MKKTMKKATKSLARLGSFRLRVVRLICTVLVLLMAAIPAVCWDQTPRTEKPTGADPLPQPAVHTILAAFDKYEVVAMPADHGLKDLDDLIFELIRNPAFPSKVNDVVVECGNSLYQPVLDRYIAGEDVPLTEARKVWRNTTQPICGQWGFGFFEQLYPLLRAVNQKLPPAKRLRVLAGDPPIEWEHVKGFQDMLKFGPRDASIASVMEREVLAKHRRALMLFGTFHLFHMSAVRASAVSMFEKDYPGVTFVISDLTMADAEVLAAFENAPSPSLAFAKGTWVASLDLGHFLPPPMRIDQDCNLHNEFPKHLQQSMEQLVDAFLYLGPKDLLLREQLPAYILLDSNYMAEVRRREAVLSGGASGTQEEFQGQFVNDAENPLYPTPKPPEPKEVQANVQSCLERKSHASTIKTKHN